MKRLLLVFFILPLLTTCEMFDNDMPAFLDFYSGIAAIASHAFEGSPPKGKDDKINISSESDKIMTFHLNNPQKYNLNLGINWNNSLLTRTTAEPPEIGKDYTLKQNDNDKSLIRLTFKQDFLKRKDLSVNGGDISGIISLTESESGRAFESYPYLLESNSPPPPDTPWLMKQDTLYVLCFKLPNFTLEPKHEDIVTLKITNNSDKTDVEYTIAPANGNGDGAVTNNNADKILVGSPAALNLEAWRDGEDGLPDGYDDNEDGIFYLTGIKVGNSIDYTVTLIDDNDLISKVVISDGEQPTVAPIGVAINLELGTVLYKDKYHTKNKTVTLRLSPLTNVSGIVSFQTTNSGSSPTSAWISWNGNSTINSPPHEIFKPATAGLKTIYVWVKDSVGNVSLTSSITVTIDKIAPSPVVEINVEGGTSLVDNTYYTTENYVTLKLSPVTDASGIAGYQITNAVEPPTSPDGWETWDGDSTKITPRHTLKNPTTEEEKTIYVWVKDNVGNVSAAKEVNVTRIAAGPTVGVAINLVAGTVLHEGKYYTNTANVTLKLTAETANEVATHQVTNSSNPPTSDTWINWSDNSTEYSHNYPLVNTNDKDVNEIYVWVKDSVENVSLASSVTVNSDITARSPKVEITVEDGTYYNGTKYFTTDNYVTLKLSPVTDESGIAWYQITNEVEPPTSPDGWETWDGDSTKITPRHTLKDPTTEEEKTIYVWVKDNVGNVSAAKEATVTYLNIPTITTVTIGGKPVTHSRVNLSSASTRKMVITVSKIINKYQITATDNSPTTWVNYSSSSTININDRSFAHNETLYIWAKDIAGNVSNPYPVTITNNKVYLNPSRAAADEDGSSTKPVATMDEALRW